VTKWLKLSFLALCFFFFANHASAQGALYHNIAWRYTPAGAFPAGGATVTICTSTATGAPCTPKLTIYQDSALSIPVANPLAQCTSSPQVGCIDNLGNFAFYMSQGPLTYTISGAGLTPYGPIPDSAIAASGVSGTLPNSSIACAPSLSFPASANASYGVTLNCNVTSSVVTGSPANGNLLSLTLLEAAPGGWTFAFPGNFVFPVGYTFDTVATHTNALTFKYDSVGAVWNLISNSGSGGGATPAGPTGTLQCTNGSILTACGAVDDGTNFTLSRDFIAQGPNPLGIDVRTKGAKFNGSAATTGTMTAGLATATLGAAQTFVNGEGITLVGAGTTLALSTPSAPTVLAADPTYMLGTNHVVANPAGNTSAAYSIRAMSIDGQITPASATTTISNQQPTLGRISVAVTTWTRANNILTVTTASPHTMVQFSYVMFTGDPNLEGAWNVTTVPDNTHITLTQNQDTRNGASAAMAAGVTPTLYYWHCNHITWSPVTNAFRYMIYRGATLIGISYPENAAVNNTAIYDSFDDFGSGLTVAPPVPAWWPTAPNTTGYNGNLTTTILSGAGTTTVTLNATAGSNTTAAQFVHDDAAPIRAAALVAQAHNESIYIPVGDFTTQSFAIQSVLTLGDTGPISIIQAGNLALNDTVYFTGGHTVTWNGFPENPQNNPTTGFQAFPQVFVGNAIPGIYLRAVGANKFANLSVNVSGVNGVGMVVDGGSIPTAIFSHMQFGSSGATNYFAKHQVFRVNNGGGSGFYWSYPVFSGGVAQGTIEPSPLMMFEGQGGEIMSMDHVELLEGTISIANTNVLNLHVDEVDDNGADMPIFNFVDTNGSGTLTLAVDISNVIDDTSARPVVNYGGNTQGYIRLSGVQGQAGGYPSVVGPGGVAVACQGERTVCFGGLGQNMGTHRGLMGAFGIDGITVTNSGTAYGVYQDAHLALSPAFTGFVYNLPQTSVTCATSGAGTANGVKLIQVGPVFGPNNAEGALSNVCTTGNLVNQGVLISWPQVAGAVGYDIYINAARLQCAVPGFSGLTLSTTWTGTTPCGNSTPLLPMGGPTSFSLAALYSPAIKIASGNGGGTLTQTFPTATADRAITWQDAGGVVPMLGVAQNWTALQTFSSGITGTGSVGTLTELLNQITAATATNTIANGNNPQLWNWAQTSNTQSGMTFGETSAATGGTLGNQYGVKFVGLAGSTAVPVNITSSLTGSQTLPTLHITPTWNTSGVVAGAILVNVTNTASGTGSLLADLQIGGTSQWKLDKAGNTTQLGSGSFGSGAPACTAGTAGALCLQEGTDTTNVSGASVIDANSTTHEFTACTNGSTTCGMLERIQPTVIHQTAKVAAISTATLCASAAGACNVAGQYHVHYDFIETGTACGTPGTGGVTFLLTWTDSNATVHSAVSLGMDDASAINSVSQTFHFQTTLAAAWASGDFNISTSGAVIQYATGYTACGVGTGTYQLDAVVTRLQ